VRAPWARLAAGAILLLAVVLCVVTRWTGIAGSHPAYAWTLLLTAVVAAGLLVSTLLLHRPRASWAWLVGRIATVVAAVAAAAILWWLRPFGATEIARDAMRSDAAVHVDVSWTRIRLEPTQDRRGTGLVFYPGARIDPRAYAHILRAVAEAGYPVVIVKPPYDLAVTARDAAADVAGDEPGERWVVAGHSLGGVVAAAAAGRTIRLAGLVLWASYPDGDLSDRTFPAVSIWGSQDQLTTPADITRSRAKLPPGTTFVKVRGANHSAFANCGQLPGDGPLRVAKVAAQDEITAATIAFLARVDG
jgi:pimeloyl-ACP methyl ester carboxylesterase